ncbi:hypothetical protein V6N11_001696 [Hibiscus sabdariffa]|uniref:Reverse transcriptase zinc-binding domain-containing protein n=2 Tax=Hibiscus sabdariffa TaxID=183260 RepID=A0ABR2G4P3_9ROSI
MGNLTQPWNCFFSSFVWQVWKRRNDLVFNGECMSLVDVYRLSLAWASHFSALDSFLLHHSLAHTEAVSWKPHPTGWYVLNFDAAVLSSSSLGIIGGPFADLLANGLLVSKNILVLSHCYMPDFGTF